MKIDTLPPKASISSFLRIARQTAVEDSERIFVACSRVASPAWGAPACGQIFSGRMSGTQRNDEWWSFTSCIASISTFGGPGCVPAGVM